MYLRRTRPARQPKPLGIGRYRALTLNVDAGTAQLDGKQTRARSGCWMFYLPKHQLKLFHARHGCTDCIHPSRPANNAIQQSGVPLGRYTSDEWRAALQMPLTQRLAELWIVSSRLWKAGLGPQPLGLCFVDTFSRDGETLGPTCGLITENVFTLRRKLRCRLEHLTAAGVQPDKIMSCIRQQVRGYVIDLCSVVGCAPTDADDETAALATLFESGNRNDALIDALQQTLSRE